MSTFYDSLLRMSYRSKEFLLMDISTMLERVMGEGEEKKKTYARISKYPLDKLMEIHEELLMCIVFCRPLREEVLFLNYERKGVGNKKCSM